MADWKPCILEAKPGLSFDLISMILFFGAIKKIIICWLILEGNTFQAFRRIHPVDISISTE